MEFTLKSDWTNRFDHWHSANGGAYQVDRTDWFENESEI